MKKLVYKLNRFYHKLKYKEVDTKEQLDKLVKRANILTSKETKYKNKPEEDYVSMEHFVAKLKHVASEIEEAYYLPISEKCVDKACTTAHDTICDNKINEAIEILQGAKTFNKLYGL